MVRPAPGEIEDTGPICLQRICINDLVKSILNFIPSLTSLTEVPSQLAIYLQRVGSCRYLTLSMLSEYEKQKAPKDT